MAGRDPQHARLVGAEPDLDVVQGEGPGVQPCDGVVLALDRHRPRAGPVRVLPPDAPDDTDRLDEGVDRLAGRAELAARGHDRVPEGTGAQTQLGAAAADDVEGRDLLGEAHGWTKRQVGHVGRDPDRVGARGDRRQQGRGVEVLGVVGVVLDGEHVEPDDVGELRQLECLVHP